MGTWEGYTGYCTQPVHWYCQGPTIPPAGPFLRPLGTPGPSWALRTPSSSHSAGSLLQPIRARFSCIYLKVSIKPRVSSKSGHEACHTPYIKNSSKCHDLEFSDFQYPKPSLARNKWSCFRLQAYFMVKTAKCHRMCIPGVNAGTMDQRRYHGSTPVPWINASTTPVQHQYGGLTPVRD